MENDLKKAIDLIVNSKYTVAFTGAGISVESGIPPFRGETGLWSKYNPEILDLTYFSINPVESWRVIKEIFYDFFGEAKPNDAHIALAELEKNGIVKAVITQNIDNLHYEAGSKEVYEFHGNSRMLVCQYCSKKYKATDVNLADIPLCDHCHAVLKPDFIFFGEGIPELAYKKSFEAAKNADLIIIIGSTGEVVPASSIPSFAKQNGAKIIEINPEKTLFTNSITDIFLQGKATEIMNKILIGIKQKL
ncbi:MAG: NAD-dependent deacylase [Bacteroidales bacterium]|nr:NAD-dependent deacylase [Bacteroidales bacterium]